MAPDLRLSYNPSIPFTKRVSFLLCCFWGLSFCGLFIWTFLSSAKQRVCTSYFGASYNADTCEATPITFAGTYYTRTRDAQGAIGNFPWTPLAFGNNNGPIDYAYQSLNWTGQPLQCVMYEQYLTLTPAAELATMSSCYYCGPDLRILCTSVDSARSQVPTVSATAIGKLLDQFAVLSFAAHRIATTAQQGAIVSSVRITTKRPVPGLEAGVLPYSEASQTVTLGTDAVGSFPIFPNNSNAAVASVATAAQDLSTLVEQATSLDLQPSDAAAQQRTLQVPYICRTCPKQYKPTLEIIQLLITGIFAVLGPAFAAAKLIAEWTTTDDQSASTTQYDPANQYDPKANAMPLPTPSPGASGQQYPLGQASPMQQVPYQSYQYYPSQP